MFERNLFTPITSDSFIPKISFEDIENNKMPLAMSESYSQINISTATVTPSPHLLSNQARANKPKINKNHPSIPNMIDEAILERSLRGKGLSLVAVKKYLLEKYDINVKHSANRIREYIKESITSGRFIQKSGRGANGRFNLARNVRSSLNRKKHKSLSETRRQSLSVSKSKKAKKEKTEPSRSRIDKKQR